MNDAVTNKIQSIQRCVRRAREEYEASVDDFEKDYTHQDAALLNIMRACETTIDLANYVIRLRKLGIPVSTADSFDLLLAERIISGRLAERMKKMVGFRNIMVHQYTGLDIRIVRAIITSDLDELLEFAEAIRKYVD